ncbi:MAG: ABC transporter permease [Clostridium sp.]
MNFKYAIKSMKKNLIFNLLLFIQVSLAFTVIYKGIEIDASINAETDKIFNFFKDNKVYTIKDVGRIQTENINSKEEEILLNKVLKEEKTIFTQQINVGELIEYFDGYENFLRYDSIAEEFEDNGIKMFQVSNLLTSKNFLETFNIKLDSGSFFKDGDFIKSNNPSKTRPVVLGYDFKEHFNLGDKIKTIDGASLEVVGFLAKNQVTPYVLMKNRDHDKYLNLNKFILQPYNTPTFEYWYNFLMFDKSKSDADISKFIFSIQKDFEEKVGQSVEVEDLTDIINENLDIYKMQKDLSNMAMVSIIFFLLLSLIVTNLNLIIKRKKEFGIHILNGGSLKDIATRIYLETFLVLISAFIIFILGILLGNQGLNTTGILCVLVVAVLISIAVTIIPIIKIMKLSIPSIIKGDE